MQEEKDNAEAQSALRFAEKRGRAEIRNVGAPAILLGAAVKMRGEKSEMERLVMFEERKS